MQFLRLFRWIFLITGIIFSSLYIACPNAECPSVIYVCNIADEVQGYVQPVIVNYFQPVVQPVISKVDNYYEKSTVKVYVNQVKSMTRPYTDNLANYLLGFQEGISAFREKHEERIIKATYDSATNVVKVSTIFLKDTVFPTIYEACKFLYSKFQFYSLKTRIWLTIRWKVYGRPVFYSLAQKIADSRVGDFLIRLYLNPKTQKTISFISKAVDILKKGIDLIIRKVEEVYSTSVGFKNTESYKNLQLKTNFLWDAFNYLSNEEQSEETLSTITLTATITSTKSGSNLSASASVSTTSSVATAVDAGVPINIKYSKLLTSTVESAANDFHAQIEDVTGQFRRRLHDEFLPELKRFNYNVESGFEGIQSAIDRINAFKDPKDERYVSRQYFREILATKKESVETDLKNIEKKVSKISDEYIDAVYKIRVNILETLEEFADSSLKAYSAEIVSNGDSWEEWKKHNELKSFLLQFRDELIQENPNKNLLTDLAEINRELNIVANDGISFLAILRAKANMEFQQREKEEREKGEIKKEEREKGEIKKKAGDGEDIKKKAGDGEDIKKKDKKIGVIKRETAITKAKAENPAFDDIRETKTKTITRQTVKTLYDYTKRSTDEVKVVLDHE